MKLSKLRNGEYFTVKQIDYPKEKQVYIKGDYIRSIKKYSCTKFSDINEEYFFKPDKEVFTDFVF